LLACASVRERTQTDALGLSHVQGLSLDMALRDVARCEVILRDTSIHALSAEVAMRRRRINAGLRAELAV